jgi:D-glycero-alpha-D-manno-heptose 1-phosphate guanylyltransferase
MTDPSISAEYYRVPQAVILAGGLGTRLRSVCADVPKPMVPVIGRPFLDYIVEYLCGQGFQDIIISSGYKGDQIEAFFSRKKQSSASIRCLRESQALGTGGALSFVAQSAGSCGYLLACNGDSLTPFSVNSLKSAIAQGADAAIVAVRTNDCGRFGSLMFDSSGLLTAFAEKCPGQTEGFINAGIYLMDTRMLPKDVPVRAASIERDYFPHWLSEGRKIRVVQSEGPFIDIGTPESLAQASVFLKNCGLFALE